MDALEIYDKFNVDKIANHKRIYVVIGVAKTTSTGILGTKIKSFNIEIVKHTKTNKFKCNSNWLLRLKIIQYYYLKIHFYCKKKKIYLYRYMYTSIIN